MIWKTKGRIKYSWHRWFAWKPVCVGVNDEGHIYAWWTWVERCKRVDFPAVYQVPTKEKD